MTFNKDTGTAIVLLLICGALFIETFRMDGAMFGQLPSTLWPRMILVPLMGLSLVLLVRAQLAGVDPGERKSLGDFWRYYKNPIVCFLLFFIFLLTMPVMGMLLGGLAYVFVTLCFLGGWGRRQLVLHFVISLVFVIGMWAIFTQLLGVFLPEGILLRVY